MELDSINGLALAGLVETRSDETQVISGRMAVERLAVDGDLRVASRRLNNCTLASRYVGVAGTRRFDSMRIVGAGGLVVERPADANERLDALLRRGLRTDRPGRVSARVRYSSPIPTPPPPPPTPTAAPTPTPTPIVMADVTVADQRFGGLDLERLFHGSLTKSTSQVRKRRLPSPLYNRRSTSTSGRERDAAIRRRRCGQPAGAGRRVPGGTLEGPAARRSAGQDRFEERAADGLRRQDVPRLLDGARPSRRGR